MKQRETPRKVRKNHKRIRIQKAFMDRPPAEQNRHREQFERSEPARADLSWIADDLRTRSRRWFESRSIGPRHVRRLPPCSPAWVPSSSTPPAPQTPDW